MESTCVFTFCKLCYEVQESSNALVDTCKCFSDQSWFNVTVPSVPDTSWGPEHSAMANTLRVFSLSIVDQFTDIQVK